METEEKKVDVSPHPPTHAYREALVPNLQDFGEDVWAEARAVRVSWFRVSGFGFCSHGMSLQQSGGRLGCQSH